jgi:hypothetical protein
MLVSCASSEQRSGFDTDQEPGGEAPKGPDGKPAGFGGDPATAGSTDTGCSDAAKLVYVISSEGDLYSFAPAEKKFSKIGPVTCKLPGKTIRPNSMAVDRQAVAWVSMREGESERYHLFKLDTKTNECTQTKVSGSLAGMGFSIDQKGSGKETLFATGRAGILTPVPLAKVDLEGERIIPLADVDSIADIELTGTADAELYGFVADVPPALALVDKATGELSKPVELPNVETPMAFAFSFWGGDFFFYTAKSNEPEDTTNVSRYRPSDGSIDNKYMTSIGFHIVGAGVSTCAPTTFPK